MSEMYEFIDAQYATSPAAPAIACMCRWLGVSKSGYYEWRSRPESATAKRREQLKLIIRKAFDDSDGTYGHRRVWAQLARWGVRAGLELVRALMRELGLVACQPRPWRPATTQQGQAGPIPDLVNRDFTAETPGAKMVGDITYIPTWEGWLFLAYGWIRAERVRERPSSAGSHIVLFAVTVSGRLLMSAFGQPKTNVRHGGRPDFVGRLLPAQLRAITYLSELNGVRSSGVRLLAEQRRALLWPKTETNLDVETALAVLGSDHRLAFLCHPADSTIASDARKDHTPCPQECPHECAKR